MLEFSQDLEIKKVAPLLEELFKNVLYDEDPLFISDEAQIWDVSMSDANDVLSRLSKYYDVPVTMEMTKQPLWKFLRELDEKRKPTRITP
jgi:hypothetical protein